jgi:hypothetical protein
MWHFAQGQELEVGLQSHGFLAAVGFHQTYQHDFPRLLRPLGGTQHGVRFANTSTGTEIDAQFSAQYR